MPDAVQAVKALDNFVSSVYLSSPEYVRAKDPGACDMEAMTSLTCNKENPSLTAPWASKLNHDPIRGVNLGGLFILERWILTGFIKWDDASEGTSGIVDTLSFSKKCASVPSGSICNLYDEHVNNFYTQSDFDAMKQAGLNTVRVSVGYWLFTELSGVKSRSYVKPKLSIHDLNHPLTKIIQYAKQAELQVILTLAPVTEADIEYDVSLSPLAVVHTDSQNDQKSAQQPLPSITSAVAVTAASVTIATAEALAAYVKDISTYAHHDNVLMIEINSPASHRVFDTLGDKEVIEQSVQKIRQTLVTIPILVLESSFVPNENVLINNQKVYSNLFINTKVYHSGNVQDIASDGPEADREKMFAHEKIACGFKAPLHFTTCTRRPTLVGEFSLAIDNCITKGTDPKFPDYGQCNNIEEREGSGWWQRHTKSFAMRQIDTYERELGWVFFTYKLDDVTEATNPSAAYWSFKKAVQYGLIDLSTPSHACAHKPESDFFMGDATYPPSTSKPIYYWIPPQPTFLPTLAPVLPAAVSGSSILSSLLVIAAIAVGGFFIFYVLGGGTTAPSRTGYEQLSSAHNRA